MAGKARRYFPGGNTPEGFFSYYNYILSQREAEKIFCIKGGPGVGKSTFMKRIGEALLEEGRNVDFLHCSSDPNSLDGILLVDDKIALVDATAPHVVDPINPGAVDTIVHLGDFWDEKGIRIHREEVIDTNERIGDLFRRAYEYLGAAGKMLEGLRGFYKRRERAEEYYKIAAGLINQELTHKELSSRQGRVRKLFASAITPDGLRSHLGSLVGECPHVYLFQSPVGVSPGRILELFMESALYRGFDVDAYYCPMDPAGPPEHLVAPDLGVALVTCNDFHSIDVTQLCSIPVCIYLEDVLAPSEKKDIHHTIAEDNRRRLEDLLEAAIRCLAAAKKEHDLLETYYIPNMDFCKVDGLREKITEQLR